MIIEEFAPAKINLTLRVLGRRADGYHELQSLVVFAADIGDVLRLETGPRTMVTSEPPTNVEAVSALVSGPFASQIIGENLIARALDLLAQRHPQLQWSAVQLDKHLPVAAGIGGGSADAGAVLRAVRRANADITDKIDWLAIALELGADVPVCFKGAPAIMTGIGETVTPLQTFPDFHAVLVNPLAPMPRDKTRRVFEILQAPLLADGAGQAAQHSLVFSNDAAMAFIERAGNDLQAASLRIAPVIADMLAALEATAQCRLARMSGAGPTCFGLYDTATAAQSAAQDLSRQHSDWWVKPTRLCGAGGGEG